MAMDNPFLEYLEGEPKAAYFSYSDQFGGQPHSRRQERFYQDSFTELYNRYLGTLGKQIRAGLMPTDTFSGDYLGGFNFNDYYRQQVPYGERNQGRNNFAPSVRWDVLGR